MGPLSQADGCYMPGLIDEAVPGVAAVVEDIAVGGEDPIGEPIFAHELPDILDWVEFG